MRSVCQAEGTCCCPTGHGILPRLRAAGVGHRRALVRCITQRRCECKAPQYLADMRPGHCTMCQDFSCRWPVTVHRQAACSGLQVYTASRMALGSFIRLLLLWLAALRPPRRVLGPLASSRPSSWKRPAACHSPLRPPLPPRPSCRRRAASSPACPSLQARCRRPPLRLPPSSPCGLRPPAGCASSAGPQHPHHRARPMCVCFMHAGSPSRHVTSLRLRWGSGCQRTGLDMPGLLWGCWA